MPYTLYKIYYANGVVYLGRTIQPLNSRLRGHFFAKPMHKKIDIGLVTKIEYAECKTCADMYLYEIYYINTLHPVLNCDDKAKDSVTVCLPELTWAEHTCHLMDKWKREISQRELEITRKQADKTEKIAQRSRLRKQASEQGLTAQQRDELYAANGF